MTAALCFFLLCALGGGLRALGAKNATLKRGATFRPFFLAARTGALLIAALFATDTHTNAQEAPQHYYLGFDRNDYPGDDTMKLLRREFTFTGYWLGNPPGETTNSWAGKRELLRSLGFGFLVLYKGREDREVTRAKDSKQLGEEDARATAEAAKREGFPSDTVIFLDLEEGGRLSAAYHSYIQGWLGTLTQFGYRGGFYCSGIPVREDARSTITTADDISNFLRNSRPVSIWVFNDSCPPSPGCSTQQNPPAPSKSGTAYAQIWQYVRSPRDKQTARRCRGYAKDGNCYASLDTAHKFHLDVNSATSADPSGGAK